MINTTSPLSEKITELAVARQKYEERKATLDMLRANWENANRGLFESVAQLKADVEEADVAVRTLALESGEKNPHPAVQVKEWDEAVFDFDKALDWSRLYAPLLLMLNKEAYDKMLRVVHNNETMKSLVPDMPGQVVQKKKASVARDLSEYVTDTPVKQEVSA